MFCTQAVAVVVVFINRICEPSTVALYLSPLVDSAVHVTAPSPLVVSRVEGSSHALAARPEGTTRRAIAIRAIKR